MNNSNDYPANYNPADDIAIDFRRYLSLFISNWYWLILSLFISLSIAYGINRWSEKVYTVSSTLLIKDDQNGALTEIFPGSEGFRSQQKVNNEIGILKSFNLNYRVMKELPEFNLIYTSVGKRGIAETRLYKNSPFVVIYDSLEKQIPWKKIEIKILSDETFILELDDFRKEMKFGYRFNEHGFNFIVDLRKRNKSAYKPGESNRYYFYFIDPMSMANLYRSKLAVVPIEKDASLVTLSTTGYDPLQESDYLNTLMKVYLEFGLEYKNLTAAQTIDFIERQLLKTSDSLKLAENDLESFRLKNKIIDISREGSDIQNRLVDIDAELSRLKMQKSYYEYLKDYIDSRSETADIISPSVMSITDELLIKLVDELLDLQKQKRQLSQNLYQSSKPLLILEENISATRKAISQNIRDGLLNTEKWISESEKKLSGIENEIRHLPSTERQMITIQRKFDINNTVYTFLLEKRAEAGIAKASNVPDNRIIDYAGLFSSGRIKPKEKQNMMISIILGILIPLILIIVLDYFNNKIIDKGDIERGTGAPIMGYVSHNVLKSELPVCQNPGSTLSESFRSVRTNLKYFLNDTKCPVISVSSTITSEGKTFISSNLAAILALSGKKILLIGLDLRRPRIHKIFDISNEKGLSNYLIGEQNIDSVAIESDIENLWYAPAGPVPPNPAELIESERMKDFIKYAKERFDYIIIDTPPVAIVTDALLVSSLTDFYLFVVRQRYSSRNTLDLIEELYRKGTIKSIGIVVNDISTSGYYGYGLRYGYALGYGYNYGYNYYDQYGKYGNDESVKKYYKS